MPRPTWLRPLQAALLTLFAVCGVLLVFTDTGPRVLLWVLAAALTMGNTALSHDRKAAQPGRTVRVVDRKKYSRAVLGWPAAVLAVGLGLYAVISVVTGEGDRALVLGAIAAVNAFVAGTVLLD